MAPLLARVDGRAVIQISSNKNRVRLFPQNLRNHAPQKIAVSHMPKVQIADQRRSSPAPRRRQVRQSHRRSRDSRPACVENPVESGQSAAPNSNSTIRWKFTSSPASRATPKIIQEKTAAKKRKVNIPNQTAATCKTRAKQRLYSERPAAKRQQSSPTKSREPA